jgi:hypothetical protein
VLIVLDASSSMNDDSGDRSCSGGCGATSKWAQVVGAINRLVGDTQTTVNWGLAIFPAPGTACDLSGGVAVPVGTAHAAAIAAAIAARTSPNGGVIAGGNAPIRSAVNGAIGYLSGLTDTSLKSILLATAGAPSCIPGSGDTGADDSAGSVQAITSAATWGFRTMVLGSAMTGGMADRTLDQMAIAGGDTSAGSPHYTPASSIGQLTDSSRALLAIDPPCIFSVPPPPTSDGTVSRSNIGVIMDGYSIPPDSMNGWTYLDATLTSFELHGSACEAFMSGTSHTVGIVFHCLLP